MCRDQRNFECFRETLSAFAALKSDGSLVSWGRADYGGDVGSVGNTLQSGVSKVFGNDDAFAVVKTDGSVVAWGSRINGGDSSSLTEELSSGVASIYGTGQAFAALKTNGSVVTWGSSLFGGDSSAEKTMVFSMSLTMSLAMSYLPHIYANSQVV